MEDVNNGTTGDSGESSSGLSTTEIGLIAAAIIFVWLIMCIIAIYCWCKSSGKSKKKSKRQKKENSDEEKIIGKPMKKGDRKSKLRNLPYFQF